MHHRHLLQVPDANRPVLVAHRHPFAVLEGLRDHVLAAKGLEGLRLRTGGGELPHPGVARLGARQQDLLGDRVPEHPVDVVHLEVVAALAGGVEDLHQAGHVGGGHQAGGGVEAGDHHRVLVAADGEERRLGGRLPDDRPVVLAAGHHQAIILADVAAEHRLVVALEDADGVVHDLLLLLLLPIVVHVFGELFQEVLYFEISDFFSSILLLVIAVQLNLLLDLLLVDEALASAAGGRRLLLLLVVVHLC